MVATMHYTKMDDKKNEVDNEILFTEIVKDIIAIDLRNRRMSDKKVENFYDEVLKQKRV